MLTSPRDVFIKAHELKTRDESFVLATVVAVRGATSAKTGSKAIFDASSRNILGWVGGGCAESFLAREAAEALKEKSPRIVTVDLDDEVFGLMPCGGVMDVYLEPHFSAPAIDFATTNSDWNATIAQFVKQLGFESHFANGAREITDWPTAFREIAMSLARHFDRPLNPLRQIKSDNMRTIPKLAQNPPAFLILGASRITEELTRLAALLNWRPTVYAMNSSSSKNFVGAAVCEIPQDFSKIEIPQGSWMVAASHHQQDHEFINHALKNGAEYVGLVASAKRSGLIGEDLQAKHLSDEQLRSYFAPAGLSLPTETPSQIAFSILCEILYCQETSKWT